MANGNRLLKMYPNGMSLSGYTSQASGEFVFQVCDKVGLIFSTVLASDVEEFERRTFGEEVPA